MKHNITYDNELISGQPYEKSRVTQTNVIMNGKNVGTIKFTEEHGLTASISVLGIEHQNNFLESKQKAIHWVGDMLHAFAFTQEELVHARKRTKAVFKWEGLNLFVEEPKATTQAGHIEKKYEMWQGVRFATDGSEKPSLPYKTQELAVIWLEMSALEQRLDAFEAKAEEDAPKHGMVIALMKSVIQANPKDPNLTAEEYGEFIWKLADASATEALAHLATDKITDFGQILVES